MTEDRTPTINRNFSLYPEQEAVLIQFAKDNAQSVSGALRFIITDWVRMKRAALEAARPLEEQPA